MQFPSIKKDSLMQSASAMSEALGEGRSSRMAIGSSLGDSRARIFQSLVKELGWKGAAQDYGLNMRDSLASYDLNTRSLKTWVPSLFEDCNRFSARLPMSGIMLSGRIYGPAIWERPIDGNESGSWPTPKAMDASNAMPYKTVVKNGRLETISKNGKTGTSSLNAWVKRWPTPTQSDSRGGANTRMTPETCRGQLKNVARMFPTPDVRGFTNEGSLEMLASILENQEEFKGMAYRAGTKKKMKHWPTPTVQDFKHRGPNSRQQGLSDVMRYPTPGITGLSNGSGNCEAINKLYGDGKITEEERRSMRSGNGGQLNPKFVAWLMGYPLTWTDTRAEYVLRLTKKPTS